tara:strand:+ start:933 stop:1664 length:732 start_codon:yes stop_codon:yes gene_type:complete
MVDNLNNEEWHKSNEVFFKSLGDEAQLQALCHMKSHEEFSKRSRHYQLPIIILSVICGSGNFVSTSFPDNQDNIILGVGVLSIITSIVSSIAQYLKLAEKSEAHRIAYVSWEKFYNNIRFQLSKRREEREELTNYMSSVTNEYQRLQEISPLLPDNISKTILWNKKKIIKQGMNVPVSLRSIQPTSWWDDKNNDLTFKNHNIFDDEEDGKKKKKDKQGEDDESVTIELVEGEEKQVTINETRI